MERISMERIEKGSLTSRRMSDLSIKKSTLLTEEILDREWIQRQLESFCTITNLVAYAVDVCGQPITSILGNEEQVNQFWEMIGENKFQELFQRITESNLEEQIIENSDYANVKIAVMTITSGEKEKTPLFYLFIVGVIESTEFEQCEGEMFLSVHTITEKKFQQAIDLLRDTYKKIYHASFGLFCAEAESRQSKCSMQETKHAIKRIEVMTEIVQFLESDDSIEDILEKILLICGQHLQISCVQIFREKKDTENVEVISRWMEEGILLEQLSQKAVTTIPIRMNGSICMYVEFKEHKRERSWSLEEVKFMHDAVRIMRSIIIKRIQKNSLASSYASLEAILDNVGSAIYVKDFVSNQVLFVNEMMRNTFGKEMQEGILEEILTHNLSKEQCSLKSEIYYEPQKKWYDLYVTFINWVDGREVILYAVYEITDKKAYQKKMEERACTDYLTGMHNRMCCERDLQYYMDSIKEKGTNGALLYLDLDDFKNINDGLGHQYGDDLLKEIAYRMQSIEEIQNTCYRIGGDEFVIILPPENNRKYEYVIEKMREVFCKPWFVKGADYFCTMSMGVVHFPKDGDNIKDLIKKADLAMYKAKKSGKNCVASYSDILEIK